MMEAVSIPYFRELLAKHLEEFKICIKNWESISLSENVPEDVRDEIRSTVGLTNLLMRQKMKQFGELIDDSENKRGEKEITCVDLQGFWDMVYTEVEKLRKSFLKLEKCQKNNWVFNEEPATKVESKKKETATVNPKVQNAAKERAIAARQRLAEAKLKMKSKLAKKNEDVIELLIDRSNKAIKDSNEATEQSDKSDESPGKRSKRMETNTEQQEMETQAKVSKEVHTSLKSDKTSNKKKNKENVLSKRDIPKSTLCTPNDKIPLGSASSNKKTPREVIPLQCLTRSARKALLEKENALQDK